MGLAFLAHLDRLDLPETTDNPAVLANLAIPDNLGKVPDKDHPDLLDQLVMLVHPVKLVNPVILDKMEDPEHDQLAAPDQKDHLVNPAALATQEVPDKLADPGSLVMLVLPAQLVNPVDLVNLEVLANLAAVDFLAQMLLIVLAQVVPQLFLVAHKLMLDTKGDAFNLFLLFKALHE